MDSKGLAGRIREARTRKGWTQEDLASQVEVRAITVSRYERGASKNPDAKLLQDFATALGVSPAWLLTGQLAAAPEIDDDDVPPGAAEFFDMMELPDEERDCLLAFGRAAVAAGRAPTPQAYQGWLAMLRMQPMEATKR